MRKKAIAVVSPHGVNNVEMRKWAAEEALRTMTRAEEIKRDPQLMSDVKRLAAKQQQMLSSVAGKSTKRSTTSKG